jgi:galactose oxidase
MGDDRYYPTLTQLGKKPVGSPITGKIVVMSGWIDGGGEPPIFALEPQYYDENDGWHYFPYPSATQPFSDPYDYYPYGHLVPFGANAGKIFYSVPMKQAQLFNPFWNGTTEPGYWQPIGTQRSLYRVNASSTMLPLIPPNYSSKVLIIGGARNYAETTFAYNSAEIIDIATASANTPWQTLDNFLTFACKNHISLMLPNDMLFVVGGNVRAFLLDPVYTAELIDTTQTSLSSIVLPAHVYARAHHSTALLLPDATVLLGGG